jgi:hypothetical protein
MRFINPTESTVYVAIGRGISVKPKDVVEIPEGYSQPRLADNGSRRPSIIEELAPQLQPADELERATWLQAPQRINRQVAKGMPTVDGLVASGVPRGQAEIIVRAALEAALEGLADAPVKAARK